MSSTATTKDQLSRFAYLLVILISIVAILVYTEQYVIPFVIALLVWFIIHETREYMVRIPFVEKHVPVWVQSTISFLFINLILFLLINMVYMNMSDLSDNLAEYEANFSIAMLELDQLVDYDLSAQLDDYTAHTDFTDIITVAINTATSLFGDGFLILIYVIFLLIEETVFEKKMKAFFPNQKNQDKQFSLMYKMDQNIGQYLLLKTLVSFITGMLSYFALLAFGIDAPVFWAMLIFVLNFIPTIGSLIATLFPAFFGILQFGELAPFLYILASVGAIQVVVGNIIEPKMMGNSLNISSLVVILSLTIWGAIWGVMGMILSVPITVMMIIVFEEIPSLRFVAVALSESGELNSAKKKTDDADREESPQAI